MREVQANSILCELIELYRLHEAECVDPDLRTAHAMRAMRDRLPTVTNILKRLQGLARKEDAQQQADT